MPARARIVFVTFLAILFSIQVLIYFYGTFKETGGIWLENDGKCQCNSRQNCYSHPTDENACGKCFACNKHALNKSKTVIAETVIAVSSNEQQMSRLLVLIGSMHTHYPKKKLLVYNNFISPRTSLKKSLISIRNVEVIEAFDVVGLLTSQALNSYAYTPFFIQHALSRYESVLWVSDHAEFLSRDVDASLKLASASITVFGRQPSEAGSVLGFSNYFPAATLHSKNFTALYFKRNSWNVLTWIAKCAGTKHCYDCRESSGRNFDCLPHLLSRLSSDYSIEYKSLPSKTLDVQRWAPPHCGFKCIMTTLASVITCLIVIAGGVLLYFSKCIHRPEHSSKVSGKN